MAVSVLFQIENNDDVIRESRRWTCAIFMYISRTEDVTNNLAPPLSGYTVLRCALEFSGFPHYGYNTFFSFVPWNAVVALGLNEKIEEI